ncbi:glutaminyl-peptide cyclotransferase [Candidatus Acetothermia bacterium]|jgi:glutamine cyclotransferase|nr:glutaminyl-peptide cyclotransferase [Candidatus Acetothermia bacterium]MCI2431717.1 glutaminyl-peptide cyclotransferase [Candidatus Acetothermia bacterium]MCI2436687.1 glutaminyl-peptide cyclotransferase [Candidatus Acetothermia bacterium]
MKRVLFALVLAALALLGLLLYWGGQGPPSASNANTRYTQAPQIPVYGYKIVKTYPHDPYAFTQGLVYENGVLYEGTGLYGQSTLRMVELETGQVLKLRRLDPRYFGEGITIWKNRIVQLTWQEKTGFVYDKASFDLLKEFSYTTEGWGITHDGQKLIMSDGSAHLYFLDPETFQEIGRLTVTENDKPVVRLNELEFIKGVIYANIWQTDRIAVISLETGRVEAWIDLAGLLKPENRKGSEDVLNGIAYDAQGDRFFVTGKLWPKLFHIELMGPK